MNDHTIHTSSPLDELRRQLFSGNHFASSSLSAYINFTDELSATEMQSVKNHLDGCQDCRRLYDMVFDDELEFDREAKFAECRVFPSDGGVVLFENPEGTIRGEAIPSRLQFYRLPTGLQKISVWMDSDVRLRLSHPACDVPYLLSGVSGLSPAPERIAVRYTIIRRATIVTFSRILRYAAAAVLVVGTTLAVWMATRPSPKLPVVENPPVIKSDTANVATHPEFHNDEKVLPEKKREFPKALAFEPNPVLETYLDRHYRGSPVDFGAVRVLEDKRAVSFEWTSEEPTTIDISIVDNSNREIWRGESQTSPMEVPARLSPGLYYWFARVDDEMARVGKFTIH